MKPIQNSKSLNQQIHALGAVPNSTQKRGALLLELLVAVSILAIILSIGSESVYVSMQSGKTSSETDVALGLASEALEAVRAVSDEQWQNIYDLTKGSPYHPAQTSNKWSLMSGDEIIALNLASYTRSVVINNVSRDLTTRMIETVYNIEHDDPSTQQAVVTVSWQGAGSPVVLSNYFLRWRNKVSNQSDWSGGPGANVINQYESAVAFPSGSFNTSNGSIMLQQ